MVTECWNGGISLIGRAFPLLMCCCDNFGPVNPMTVHAGNVIRLSKSILGWTAEDGETRPYSVPSGVQMKVIDAWHTGNGQEIQAELLPSGPVVKFSIPDTQSEIPIVIPP